MENDDSATTTDERGRVRGRGDNEFIADALGELLVLQIPLATVLHPPLFQRSIETGLVLLDGKRNFKNKIFICYSSLSFSII